MPGTSWPHCFPAAPAKQAARRRTTFRFSNPVFRVLRTGALRSPIAIFSLCLSNPVFRVLRTGAPWRDLPPDYGDGCAVHRRFSRWRKKGVWAELPEAVIDEPDLE